jgi:hypothetical protein
MHLHPTFTPIVINSRLEPTAERIEILEAFSDLLDVRRVAGKGHPMALCLALFTLAVTAGNRGFLAIGDWLACYRCDLIALLNPPKSRLPSYSTIRRVLLELNYAQYSADLARFFGAESFAQRIRGYWGVENKVHHVRDVTQGEDASPIPMHQLPQIFAVARNFAINLYHSKDGVTDATKEQEPQCQG